MSIQYRLVVARGDERVAGAEGDVADDGVDAVLVAVPGDLEQGAAVAFMRGKLKATGDTGAVLAALGSGEADAAFDKLVHGA